MTTEKDLQDEIIYLRKENVGLMTKNMDYQKKIYAQSDLLRQQTVQIENMKLQLSNLQTPPQ